MSIGFLKDRETWFTKAVLIILAVTFVVGFGYVGGISLGGGGGGTGSTTAVEVNGEKVPISRYYVVRENLYRRFGQGSDRIPEAAKDYINYSAMKQIIEGKLLAQKARELGFTISDEELSEAIRSNPSFQYNGQFIGKKNYEETIRRSLNISVSDFEEGFRDELLVRKLVELIDETAKVTDEELLNLYRMQNEKIKIKYLDFSPEDFKDLQSVEEKELRDYYENNNSQFRTEEERKIKYTTISVSDFRDKIDIPDDEIEAYYSSYKGEFKDEEGNIKELMTVRDEISSILKDRKSGNLYNAFTESVSMQLEDSSIDEIVSENGLNTKISESGYFTASAKTNDLPGFIVKKSFNMDTGQTSFAKGQNEIWLIELADINEPGQESFEMVKEDVKEKVIAEKAKNAARVAAEETMNKINKPGNSFGDVARSTGIDIRETDYFTRTEAPSFFSDEQMKLDAFMLTEKNSTAKKIYSTDDHYFILSLQDKKEIDLDDFRDNKDKIKEQELVRLRRNILSGWINDLFSNASIVYNDKVLPELSITPASS